MSMPDSSLPPNDQVSVPGDGPAVAPALRRASFGLRAAAFYIDMSLLITLTFVIMVWLNSRPSQEQAGLSAVLVAWWLYFTLMESSALQATVGKWLMGIQVADQKQKRAHLLRTAVRSPGVVAAFILNGKRAFSAWSYSDNLLHDALSKTTVLEKRTAPHVPSGTLKRVLWLVVATGLMAGVFFLLVKQLSPENISLPAD